MEKFRGPTPRKIRADGKGNSAGQKLSEAISTHPAEQDSDSDSSTLTLSNGLSSSPAESSDFDETSSGEEYEVIPIEEETLFSYDTCDIDIGLVNVGIASSVHPDEFMDFEDTFPADLTQQEECSLTKALVCGPVLERILQNLPLRVLANLRNVSQLLQTLVEQYLHNYSGPISLASMLKPPAKGMVQFDRKNTEKQLSALQWVAKFMPNIRELENSGIFTSTDYPNLELTRRVKSEFVETVVGLRNIKKLDMAIFKDCVEEVKVSKCFLENLEEVNVSGSPPKKVEELVKNMTSLKSVSLMICDPQVLLAIPSPQNIKSLTIEFWTSNAAAIMERFSSIESFTIINKDFSLNAVDNLATFLPKWQKTLSTLDIGIGLCDGGNYLKKDTLILLQNLKSLSIGSDVLIPCIEFPSEIWWNNLTNLTLVYAHPSVLKNELKPLPMLKNLESLSLLRLQNVSKEFLQPLEQLPKLDHLKITYKLRFQLFLPTNLKLKTLHLRSWTWSQYRGRFSMSVPTASVLQSLTLDNCVPNRSPFRQDDKNMSGLKNLKVLRLRWPFCPDGFLDGILSGSPALRTIQIYWKPNSMMSVIKKTCQMHGATSLD